MRLHAAAHTQEHLCHRSVASICTVSQHLCRSWILPPSWAARVITVLTLIIGLKTGSEPTRDSRTSTTIYEGAVFFSDAPYAAFFVIFVHYSIKTGCSHSCFWIVIQDFGFTLTGNSSLYPTWLSVCSYGCAGLHCVYLNTVLAFAHIYTLIIHVLYCASAMRIYVHVRPQGQRSRAIWPPFAIIVATHVVPITAVNFKIRRPHRWS